MLKNHQKLVSQFKNEFGSLRKASDALQVPWKNFPPSLPEASTKAKENQRQVGGY